MSRRALKGIPADLTLVEAKREIARCHARLEIDHAYRMKGKKLVRFTIPYADRMRFPDGISCRDDSIRLLDLRVEELKKALPTKAKR